MHRAAARDITTKSSRLVVIYTEHAAPRVHVIVLQYVIRVIIALHVPETLEGRADTLAEALNDIHLHRHFASANKKSSQKSSARGGKGTTPFRSRDADSHPVADPEETHSRGRCGIFFAPGDYYHTGSAKEDRARSSIRNIGLLSNCGFHR